MNHTNRSSTRRHFLSAGLFAFAAGLLTKRTVAQEPPPAAAAPAGDAGNDVLRRHMRVGNPPAQPLDSMIVFERGDDSNGRAMTHEVLSLIHEEKGPNSYPWTLYTSLATHHQQGDGCVHCARLHKHGTGWSTGLHSEVFTHSSGTALGVNIEMSNDSQAAEPTQVIGLNIQAVGGPKPMQCGIQIHDNNPNAYFEKALHLSGQGSVGVDLAGKFQCGVNMHSNALRLDEGTSIILDGDAGKIQLRYKNGKLEFLNGDRVFAHLDVNRESSAL